MPLLETLITTVAPAITKTLLKLLAPDDKLATEGGASAAEILAKLIPEIRARKEADRQMAAIGERAAESLIFIFETEGKYLMTDDQEAVALFHFTDGLERKPAFPSRWACPGSIAGGSDRYWCGQIAVLSTSPWSRPPLPVCDVGRATGEPRSLRPNNG